MARGDLDGDGKSNQGRSNRPETLWLGDGRTPPRPPETRETEKNDMPRLPLLPMLLAAGTLSAQTSYHRSGDDWIRTEGEFAYRVDPSVVTVRTAVDRDVRAVLGRLEGELAGARLLRENRLGFRDVEVPAAVDVLEFVAGLRASGEFELVEENTIGTYGVGGVPSDPMFSSQWNMHNTGQSGGTPDADVDAVEAWGIEDGDPGIVVAVADSGTNWNHQDLIGNIWMNADEVLDGSDTDGNGYVDDVRGWDFDFNDNDPNGAFWHGTSVASVVASRGENGVGLVGLAGGGQDGVGVKVMCLNVGSFAPNASVLDDAILYAADNGAHVVTMSLSIGFSAAVDAAVAAADAMGVFIDCAAGNGGFSVSYPATLPEVMAVGSTNRFDNVSGFSNHGPEVEISAPGEDITMCDLPSTSYHVNSGTSFAAPHVAALAALILSADPSMSNADVRAHIMATADDIGAPGHDDFAGAGRINAHAALVDLAQGFARVFGSGTPGANGEPQIAATAVPTLGMSFDATVSQALAGAPAVIGLSTGNANLHVLGGVVYLDPSMLLTFGSTTDGSGMGAHTFSIPADPSFIAQERFSQWFIIDGAAPAGIAMSAGMHLRVGL